MRTVWLLLSCLLVISCKKECPEEICADADLTKGLLAYYPFNGNTNDESGNGNNGTAKNGAYLTADFLGRPNRAAGFDGFDDYIEVNDNGKLSPKSISIVAWVYPEDLSGQSIVGKIIYSNGIGATYDLVINYDDIQDGYVFGITPPSRFCDKQNPYDPIGNPYVNSVNNVNSNQWHCLIGTFHDGNMNLYVDGIKVANRQTTNKEILQCNNTQLIIGNWWIGDALPFNGKIDEVRIYDRALSECEIDELSSVFTSN